MTKPKHLYPAPLGRDPDDVLQAGVGFSHSRATIEDDVKATRTASPTQFEIWRTGLGSARAPGLLYECWTQRKISVRTLRTHLGSIWHVSDIPDYWLDHDQWRELFHAAGYTRVRYGALASPGLITYERGEKADPPTGPITVYRGAITERRDDWSWTASPAVAARWASGHLYNRPPGHVWTTTAPPDHVLCRIDRWDQYVIDTHGLTITEHKETPS
ncbi:hypothetical protein [Streptomyces sp. NPDC007905]|uniref:hypothetical protein n=1 Tax=Streptomyces sp. NPDC007905 TaxID=3364788 RepID=UPI0036ECB2C2